MNFMKNIFIATALAATFFSPQAFAQAKNFEGFGLVGNVDFLNTDATSRTTTSSGSYGQSSANLGVQAQYNLALGSQFVLGFGAAYELTKPTTAKNSATGVTFKAKNLTTAFLAPGYAISDTLLVYGKIAGQSFTEENDSSSSTRAWSGTGFGGGFQTKLNTNWFVQGELMSYDFGSQTSGTATDKLGVTSATIGIGYKF
jgi:opacity protein-like surface antigen